MSSTLHPSRRRRRRRLLAGAVALALAVTVTACGGGGEVGLVSGAGAPSVSAPPEVQVDLGPGDPVATTVPPGSQSAETTLAPASVPPTTTATTAPPTTVRPPVPLPADPAAVVLTVSIEGGFPMWSRPRVQPTQVHAGGRLVRPEPYGSSPPAYRRLVVSQVPVAEVQALVAMAEDAGATSPPADVGRDPRIADAGVMIVQVDRPGLSSKLVVPDPVESSSSAPNLTADQQARRRIALDLHRRLTADRPSTHLEAHVELVAYHPPPSQGATTTTTTPSDLRTWAGAPLQVGPYPCCFVLPYGELERRVPGWSTSTRATRWQSGPERLQIDFYGAAAPKDGCGPPPA